MRELCPLYLLISAIPIVVVYLLSFFEIVRRNKRT